MAHRPHHLVLLLGSGNYQDHVRGPSAVSARLPEKRYRVARYVLPDASAREVETPFVGEAIVRLHERGTFDHVHVLGTPGSMWHLLYDHLTQDGTADENAWLALHAAMEEGSAHPFDAADAHDPRLACVEEAFERQLGVPATCGLIPVGQDQDEFWTMLRRMVELGVSEGTLSMDITHGLRSQPLFLLLALHYLQANHEGLELGSVFYGALELARSHFEGRAPVFDLGAVTQLLAWTEAAQAFDRYGDAQPVAALLREHVGEDDKLARKAEFVSQTLQANTLHRLESYMRNFQKELRRAPGDLVPLELVRPAMERLPEKVGRTRAKWQALLHVARRHAAHEQMGLAVLTAWEAVIERAADAYGVDAADFATFGALSGAVRSGTAKRAAYQPAGLLDLFDAVWKLRTYRNAVAHCGRFDPDDDRTGLLEAEELHRHLPGLLDTLGEGLRHEALDALPQHVELRR